MSALHPQWVSKQAAKPRQPIIAGKLLCTTDEAQKLRYVGHAATNVRATFERVRREMQEARHHGGGKEVTL